MGRLMLIEAQDAGLALAIEGERLIIEGPSAAEALALDLLAHKPRVIAALAVLDLARRYDFGIAVIVDGGIDHERDHELILGEVIGGDESHWRAFADRATDAQLQEATQILQALAEAA